jgi:8-oxo-dGTP pyrophosphatase MutT (NUDIX family)
LGQIRTAARALIVREARLLLTHCRDERGDWYTAPGGGQVEGESLPETLVRECREEIGVEVEVAGLRYVRDYIVGHHDFSYLEETAHQLELFFECTVPPDYRAQNGPNPDSHQVGVIWADAEALQKLRVYPERLRDVVNPGAAGGLPVYWGDGR